MDKVRQLRKRTSKTAIRAERCRRSFEFFVKEFWGVIIPEKLIWNWHMTEICTVLQRMGERIKARLPKEYDLIINVPPGTSKSTIVSVMFPAWLWTIDPTIRTIAGSHASDLSLDLSIKCRDVVECKRYGKMFNIQKRPDQWSKGHFKNTNQGERIATSTGANIIGRHAHILIVDDPIDPESADAVSGIALAEANSWIDGTLMTRKVAHEMTPLILIMQRLHENDPTGHILDKEKDNVHHICLPAEDEYPIKPAKYKKFYIKGLLDPRRLPKTVLQEKEIDMGPRKFAGQCGQQPSPKKGNLFNIAKFMLVNTVPFATVQTIRYWDKAGTQGGGAYTVGTKMAKMKNGQYIVLDVKRKQLAAQLRDQWIRQVAEEDGPGVIVGLEQEPGSGGKDSTSATVLALAGYVVHIDKVSGSKDTRAEPYATQVISGNVYLLDIPCLKPWIKEYLKELNRFPASKYRDQGDSSSGGFNYLAPRTNKCTWGNRGKYKSRRARRSLARAGGV